MKNIKTPGLAQHIREFICKYLPVGHPDITYTSLKFSTDRASISHVINNKEPETSKLPHPRNITNYGGNHFKHRPNNLAISNSPKRLGQYLQEKKINYDLNGENFILLQSRNSGVGIVKEAKRIKANVIIYRKQKNDYSYKYKYIDKYSEVDTIQLFKV